VIDAVDYNEAEGWMAESRSDLGKLSFLLSGEDYGALAKDVADRIASHRAGSASMKVSVEVRNARRTRLDEIAPQLWADPTEP
jgi:hypothetical protein